MRQCTRSVGNARPACSRVVVIAKRVKPEKKRGSHLSVADTADTLGTTCVMGGLVAEPPPSLVVLKPKCHLPQPCHSARHPGNGRPRAVATVTTVGLSDTTLHGSLQLTFGG